MFDRTDFKRLAAALQASEGKILVSLNDVPEVRTAFAWAEVLPVKTRYFIGSGERKEVGEVLIGRGVVLSPAAAPAQLL